MKAKLTTAIAQGLNLLKQEWKPPLDSHTCFTYSHKELVGSSLFRRLRMSWMRAFVILSWIATAVIVALPMPVEAEPSWVKSAIEAAGAQQPHEDALIWVLYKSEKVRISKNGRAKSHIRKAIKLLRSSGEDLCGMRIATTDWIKVENVKGWLISPNGKTKRLDKKNHFSLATDLAAGYYDDMMVFVTGFDDVEVGSVVAYEYDIISKTEWGSYCNSFVMQVQQPVLMAEYTVEAPKGWQVDVASHLTYNIVMEDDGKQKTWIARDLPFRPEEPLMPPWSFVTREIQVCCHSDDDDHAGQFGSWEEVADWVDELFASAMEPSEEVSRFATQRFGSLSSPAEKLAAIAEFARDEIRYVAVEIGEGRIVPRSPEVTLANRYGDCKDKAALMRALLAAEGIASSAVLVSVGSRVEPDLPNPFQFNHAIVALKQAEFQDLSVMPGAVAAGWLFFDPTCPWTDLGALSGAVCGSRVLIAADCDSHLVSLPELTLDENTRRYNIIASLAEDGSLFAEISVVDGGVRAMRTAHQRSISETAEQIEGWQAAFNEVLPGVVLSDYHAEAVPESSWVSFNIAVPDYVQKSGDLNLLSVDLVPAASLPELRKGERTHPIWFGTTRKYEANISWSLPQNWVADSMIDSNSVSCEAATFWSRIDSEHNRLSFSWSLERNNSLLQPTAYTDVRRFRNAVQRARKTRIILSELTGEVTE